MTDYTQLYNKLSSIIDKNNIKTNELLKNHTYTKLGGKADIFLTPTTYEEVQAVVKFAKQENVPFTLLGNGSNLIVKDGGIRGIVILLKNFNRISVEENFLTAQSGAAIIAASQYALKENLTGLEFACGIPGTVGGALFMNAGAYGGEIKDVLDYAIVIDRNGEIVKRTALDLELSYRTSNIPEKGDIVLEAIFKLKPGNYEDIKAVMDDLTFKRESKQPLEYPSCGSVFKRPPGYFAGKLIQDSGLQGKQIGGAQVSTKHAGFIVNKDNATAEEYISLIKYVQKTVKEKFNVELEREVKIIGEDL
ncbi:UDP-N-acetylenolpyruvoylglucosamine reductase [Heyndrickxia sporothermodurans]|uniref:UDP-N-acetylenolpyruvoylglucosamine reductase n=1 Tax=Heyndrickxia sporothermodurans TaxID=46224 RepID=A0AB37HPY2_9BACI|nr:UDP-N-acetylmuramate dehydrogenase [Heyndrickxia sporothermodurans]MBL5767239.1 UDP-N-acetylmuramate dehydrogenase [Heyndrickxia sporothermodurans]MBL5770774.1 UDP-N-acetylmuramate dehydrogenase [Heyndrickxia sporothermodurans]MBL5774405.1 UDP-N-acetylmuramate dehydrogenase [Heyndrickxia sporothermodurans]MBL5777952.1 UDP-N-acetylmuramate dehydrogenase [Heyndrickxia sporothermodurans]MBL5781530.1 UDP-N-acetylmuramate dehydrogenase [Heyndrickxia sporothermodurans]